jgi:hypothetical protein
VATLSERLKHTATIEAAKNWIIRFKMLPELDQLARIGGKWIKARPSILVSARVQYYALFAHGKLQITTCDLQVLRSWQDIFDDYKVRPSVVRTKLFARDYYEQLIKEQRIEVISAPLHGTYAGFTAPTISKIRKRKMAGADRHAGFRVVGSPTFWNRK